MPVVTDLTIVPKNNAVLNPAVMSELILNALAFIGCYTQIQLKQPVLDRTINMRFVNDVMLGRIPLHYPQLNGEYIERTPTIYYPLGGVDKEGYENCQPVLQNMQDYVAVHVNSDESGVEFMSRLGLKILELSNDYHVFFRDTDIDNNYKELSAPTLSQ